MDMKWHPIVNGEKYKSSFYEFVTWSSGATSVTADDATKNWNHCELVEDEDEE